MKTSSSIPAAPISAARTPRRKTFSQWKFWFWLAVTVLVLLFLSLIKSILLPFVVGIMAAYFLDPAVRKLRQWNWSRSASAASITIVFFALAILAGVILIPLIAHQLSALVTELPNYLQNLQNKYGQDVELYIGRLDPEQVDTVKTALGNFSGTFVNWAGKVAAGALQSGLALINVLSLIFITPVVAFYLLRDWELLITQIDDLLPRDHARTIREQLQAIDRTLSGFIRGQTNVCVLMAAYYGLALTIAGLKFGLVIGILTGFMLFMPFVGFATGFVLSLLVALFQFDSFTHVLVILAIFSVGQILENSVLTPKLVGSKVGLHPVWIIFGMLSGAALFGLTGILISVPVTAVLGVLVRFAIAHYMQSPLYSGKTSPH